MGSVNVGRTDCTYNWYQLFGLRVASQLPLPEAFVVQEAGKSDADVCIELIAAVANTGAAPAWFTTTERACMFRFDGIGQFEVADGRRVTVTKHPTASGADVRALLFGAALPALMHQRRLTPMHVSALMAPAGAVAFTGPSGAGKSTLAAHLHRELAWPLISDDFAVVRISEDGPLISSGLNTLKLWRDALSSLGRGEVGLARDGADMEKYLVNARFVQSEHARLRDLVLLAWETEVSLTRLNGREAYRAVLSAVHRPELARALGNRDTLASAALELAGQIRAWRLTRPKDFADCSGVTKLIGSSLAGE